MKIDYKVAVKGFVSAAIVLVFTVGGVVGANAQESEEPTDDVPVEAEEIESCDTKVCGLFQARTPVGDRAFLEIGWVDFADVEFDTWDTAVRIQCSPDDEPRWWKWRGVVMRCNHKGISEFRFETVEALEALEPYLTKAWAEECTIVRNSKLDCGRQGDGQRFYFFSDCIDPPTAPKRPLLAVESARVAIVYGSSGVHRHARGQRAKRIYIMSYAQEAPDHLHLSHYERKLKSAVKLHHDDDKLPQTRYQCDKTHREWSAEVEYEEVTVH